MLLSPEALEYFEARFREYVNDGRETAWYFEFDDDTTDLERLLAHELRDEGVLAALGCEENHWQLTADGRRGPKALQSSALLHVGDNINISGSTFGALATGGSTADGTATKKAK